VYFGLDGDEFVILLSGGTKKTQQEDIQLAQIRWSEFLKQKKEAKNGQ